MQLTASERKGGWASGLGVYNRSARRELEQESEAAALRVRLEGAVDEGLVGKPRKVDAEREERLAARAECVAHGEIAVMPDGGCGRCGAGGAALRAAAMGKRLGWGKKEDDGKRRRRRPKAADGGLIETGGIA